jgi:hypothetical protein
MSAEIITIPSHLRCSDTSDHIDAIGPRLTFKISWTRSLYYEDNERILDSQFTRLILYKCFRETEVDTRYYHAVRKYTAFSIRDTRHLIHLYRCRGGRKFYCEGQVNIVPPLRALAESISPTLRRAAVASPL